MVSCVRLPCVCIKTWYILKMHFLYLCLKKQQYSPSWNVKSAEYGFVCDHSERCSLPLSIPVFQLVFFLELHERHHVSCSADTGFPGPGNRFRFRFWSSKAMATSLGISALTRFAKLIKAVSAVAVVVGAADLCSNFLISKPWGHHGCGQRITKIDCWGFLFHVRVTKLYPCAACRKEYCG